MQSFIQKYAGFFLLGIGIFGIILFNVFQESNSSELVTTVSNLNYLQTTQVSNLSSTVFVDIKGEIKYPGVYQVNKNMRISDIVSLSGGLLDQADVSKINMAKNVYDQMVIIIPSKEASEEESETKIIDIIYVDIKGEVLFPGVYQVQNGVRIYQVIALAGGLTSLASTWELNLSTIVTDQMVILISKKEDTQVDVTSSFSFKVFIGGEVIQPGQYYVEKTDTLRDLINMAGGLSIDALTTNLLFDMPLYEGFELIIPKKNANVDVNTAKDETGKININTAGLEALMTLKGIGNILGQRIIDYRAEYGFFLSIEDIMQVSGIKDVVYAQIKDYIIV